MQKHKHVPEHQIQTDISDELLLKFKEEGYSHLENNNNDIMDELGLELPSSDYGDEMFVRGFILAKALAYKRNNGVKPIPFPVSFSTVDIAGVCCHENEYFLLLGRKPGQTCYQFPGGFRDPKEIDTEAASREFEEEACLKIEHTRFEFHKQLFIDDIRYKDSCHKITTSLFIVNLSYEEITKAVAGDDLEEVRIFKLIDLINDDSIIRDIHRNLFKYIWQAFLSTK